MDRVKDGDETDIVICKKKDKKNIKLNDKVALDENIENAVPELTVESKENEDSIIKNIDE